MTYTLPSYDLWNGHATTLDICEPPWLYAGRMTNNETGESWRFTYLSTWVAIEGRPVSADDRLSRRRSPRWRAADHHRPGHDVR
jgi:hypothetical protein